MGEQHPHSIVLVKDQFKKNSNRYLVYDDPRWGCKLFLNYHSMPNVNDDIKNIRTRLSQELKLDENNIQGAFLFEKIHEKYSPTANSLVPETTLIESASGNVPSLISYSRLL